MPATTDSIAPTILIGLGGIGSEVVCKVYDKVPRELRAFVPIHVFDTDLNDVNKNKKILGKRATQTSRPVKVGDYLNAKDPSSPIFQWFPTENQLLRGKTLTEGAGQIRLVSRLAYLDTMERGKMGTFARQIRDMFANSDQVESTATVRVFIVCSLGGGTGAGMFLQTALYVQDLLKKYGRAYIIRGAFMLPAVYEKDIPENQVNDTRANAYACLKELDAITRNATAQLMGNQAGPTINFEYTPEQAGMDYQELAITKDHLPYNYCFIYDQLNSSGKPLPNLECYKQQMIDTITLQLFGPLRDRQFSVEDNFYREHIRAKGSNYFCGTGAARLVYPYDDLTTYFALRQAEVMIDRDWQRIDTQFAEEWREYENELNDGFSRPEPDRGKRYLALVRNAYEANDSFFSAIFRSTHILDENNRPTVSKASQFISAVNQLIEDVIGKDRDLQEAAAQCIINDEQIKEKNQAEEEISTIENNLDNYKRRIEESFHNYRSMAINRVIGSSCRGTGTGSQENYQLNYWLLRPPLHPVGVRCFLYETLNLLEEELQKNQNDNRIRKKNIDKYKDKYDLDTDDNVSETAVECLEKALEQPFYRKLLGNHFKKFIEEYRRKAGEQLNLLNKYKVEQLREMTLRRLRDLVEQLGDNWEQFFSGLNHVKTRFDNEAKRELVKHDQNQDPTIRYVLASRKAKEQFWGLISAGFSGSSKLPDDLCRQIYDDQFSLFCRQEFPNHELLSLGEGSTLTAMGKRATEVFRQSLFDHFKKIAAGFPQLDLDLGEALRQEFALEYRDTFASFTDYLQSVNRSLYKHAEPLVNYRNSGLLQPMTAWGINNDVQRGLKKCLSPEEFRALLNLDEGPSLTENNYFSSREAQLMRSTMGLCAEDLTSFQAPNGSYYVAYRDLVEKLKRDPNREITPHLDKNWHNPVYLPDLNQEVAKQDVRKKRRAFISGLIYRIFSVCTNDTQTIWGYSSPRGRLTYISQGNQNVRSTFLALYESLGYNPGLVDQVLEASLKKQADQIKDADTPFKQCLFANGCLKLQPGQVTIRKKEQLNIFDAIMQMVNDTRENNLDETVDLLCQAINEIYDFSLAMAGETEALTARNQAAALVEMLAENSIILEAAETGNPTAYEHWNNIFTSYQPEVQAGSA